MFDIVLIALKAYSTNRRQVNVYCICICTFVCRYAALLSTAYKCIDIMQSFRVALHAHDVCKNKITVKTEPEIMVGHQTFSDHFQQMLDQLLHYSDIMSDHSKSTRSYITQSHTNIMLMQVMNIEFNSIQSTGLGFIAYFAICK